MKLSIELKDLKPLSLNQWKTPFKMGNVVRMIKTKQYRDFEIKVHEQLWPSLKEIKEFASFIKADNRFVRAEYIFYVKGVITGKGTVSKKCIDVSNAIKIVEDCLFNQLGIDDSLVVHLSASKVESETNRIVINLSGHDITSIA